MIHENIQNRRNCKPPVALENKYTLAGFRANSEIIGKFRKLKKCYGHSVKRQK